MKSHEVLKRAIDAVGVKRVAADVDVSTSLIYKWCETPKDASDDERSGARNPLDRTVALMESTGDIELIAWLCAQAGGFFTENPPVLMDDFNKRFVIHSQRMVEEFSDLLRAMSESIQNDNRIDAKEAKSIRKEWQALKRFAESFVVACERGVFAERDKS